ncbi:hypothetical protein [Streptomyces sp. NPDC101393]|uniref:hypothetical protein n=1 Tax=Streptomyces sp. NPDC101393 TaxID=3366141 RepID=UPI0037F94DD9
MAHQIGEAAVFGDAAAIEDVDLAGMPDAVEAMGSQDDRLPLGRTAANLVEYPLRSLSIERAGRLIDHRDLGIPVVSSSDPDALPLNAGDLMTCLVMGQQGIGAARACPMAKVIRAVNGYL